MVSAARARNRSRLVVGDVMAAMLGAGDLTVHRFLVSGWSDVC